jgi:integrase
MTHTCPILFFGMAKQAKKSKHRGVIIRERVNTSGKVSFRVECPFAWFNRTAFRQFKTKEKAKGFIDRQLNEQERFGSLANSMSTEERLDATKAIGLLESSGASLVDCVEFYLKHNRPISGDISVSELVEIFLNARKAGIGGKRGRPLRQRSIDDLRARLGKFNLLFGSRLMKDVVSNEIETWLHRDEWSFRTRKNFYTILHTFFEYGKAQGYRADNPMKGISRPNPEDTIPGILSVVQCEKLLEAALETEMTDGILGYIVLGMFCGIRDGELKKLDWSAVDLESGYVTISPKIAKARSIRNVAIPENAMLWLMRCARRTGDISPRGWRKRFNKLKAMAGIKEWHNNALRHSAGSYHFALHEDSAKTASMLGHTQDSVLFKHYRALTKKADAVAFFKLKPPASNTVSKVVNLSN